MTSNNASGQANNVTRSTTIRRTSPTIPQHNNSSTAIPSATSPVSSVVVSSTLSATHSTILETVIPGQSIANSIISGSGGGT